MAPCNVGSDNYDGISTCAYIYILYTHAQGWKDGPIVQRVIGMDGDKEAG